MIRLRKPILIGLVAMLLLTSGLGFMAVVASVDRYYKASISPTSASTGQTQDYTLTFTNDWSSDSSQEIGSVSAAIPSGWTGVTLGTLTPPLGKSWDMQIASGLIKLNSHDAGDELHEGESVSVTFQATAPAATGTYTWTTLAYQGRGWGGALFNLKGSQPKVTVTSPSIDAQWSDNDCSQIDAVVTNLDTGKSYYVKYFDPDGILRGTSSTYSAVSGFTDHFVLDITLPQVLGTWTVKLYETPATWKDEDTVSVDKMVWTTDSTYAALKTSFLQGETVYFKAIGLVPSDSHHTYYYKFRLDPTSGPDIYVGAWTTGVTELTGSYSLSATAPIGSWELHVRYNNDHDEGDHGDHYVDCYFDVTPVVYSLTFDAVATSPLPDVAPGTVIVTGTIGGSPFTVTNSQLPKTFTGIAGATTITYAFATPVTTTISGKRLRLDSVAGPASGFSIGADTTITGTYKVQFQVTFDQTGLDGTATGTVVTIGAVTKTKAQLPFPDWFDSGTTYSYSDPVASSTAGKRFRLDSVSPASPITGPGTVYGNYVVQFQVTFDQTGLDADATGTVVTIGGSVTKTKAQLPFTDWFDSGTTYSFSSPVSSSDSGKQFRLDSVTGQGSPISTSGTITGNYKTQYQITFGQTGVGGDFAGNIVKVDGNDYSSLPHSLWLDQGDHTFEFYALLTVSSDKQYRWDTTSGGLTTARSGTLSVSASGNVVGNYKTQYHVTFDQTGLDADATGTVVTIGGSVTKTKAQLPFTDWFDSGTTYSYADPVSSSVSGKQYVKTGVTGPTSPIGGAGTVCGNYKTQFYLTLVTAPPGVTTPTGAGWHDDGDSVPISTDQYVDIVAGSSRYRFDGWTTADLPEIDDPSDFSTTVTMDKAKTVTANYVVQFKITFAQTGVGSDFTGTVVVIDDTNNYDRAGASFWWDENSFHSFAFQSPLGVSSGKQYVWISTGGLSADQANPSFEVTSSGTIEGNYKTQVKITFAQSGLDSSVTGTVVTVAGSDKAFADLAFTTGWLDSGGSITFGYVGVVASSTPGKQFVFVSADHASPLTVPDDPVTVTGSYKTQYYLTMTTNFGTVLPGSGWHDAGSHVAISAAAPIAVAGERYVWLGWTGTGTVSYTGPLNPVGASQITMNGPITEAAAWRREFRLTVASLYDSPNPSVGDHWYAAGTTINAVVTSPVYPPGGGRYVCTGWNGTGSVPATGSTAAVTFAITAPSRLTWNWKKQYYLNVSSAHGAVGGDGWYDPNATAHASVAPLIVEEAGGVRYVFISWSGDATGSTSPSDPIIMNRDKVAIANWQLQFRLDVVSAYDSPYGSGWYVPGATANFGVTTPVDLGNGTLMVFVGWSGDVTQTAPTGSIVMTKPSRVVAAWIRQYLVLFDTTLPDGNRLTIPGVPQALPPGFDIFGAFFAAGSTAAGGPAPVITPGAEGIRYIFKGWNLDGVLLTAGIDFSFLVNGPHNASMVFDTEYLLVVNATGVANPFNATLTITASPPAPYQLTPISAVEEWFHKNAGLSLLISTPNKIGHGVWAVFKQWSGSAQGTDESVSLVMSGPKTVNAIFFSTNPVAESLPYSIVAGLICFGLAYYMTRNKKGEQKGSTRITFGTAVVAVALLVAAIMSVMIATGFGINVAELPDLTNWAVLFLGAEAVVLFYITHRFTKGGQPEQAQAAPETAKVPANPYGV